MLYVGGGAGMAPMRSHLYHLFRTQTGRKVIPGMVEDLKENILYRTLQSFGKRFPKF